MDRPAEASGRTAKRFLFDVVTPLGDRVVLTRDRWREIVNCLRASRTGAFRFRSRST